MVLKKRKIHIWKNIYYTEEEMSQFSSTKHIAFCHLEVSLSAPLVARHTSEGYLILCHVLTSATAAIAPVM
jgi:hypothetical protein